MSRQHKRRNKRAKRRVEDNPFPVTWPGWVKKRIKEFDSTENKLASKFDKAIDLDRAPDWAMKMFIELYKLSAPSIPLPEEGETVSGPDFLGSLCGHLEAVVESKYGLNLIFKKMDEATKQLDGKILATLTKQQFAYWVRERSKAKAAIQELRETVEEICRNLEITVAGKMLIVQRCKNSADKQEINERLEFYDAYTRALKTKIFSGDGHFYHAKSSNEKLPTTTILFLMVSQWQSVDRFQNFGEYRRWLGKRFGPQTIGSSDRLKQLCKRYGYNPKGAPGRPVGQPPSKANEIPDAIRDYFLTSDVFKSRKRPKK